MLRGDPGSCSALGAELHRVAHTVRNAATPTDPAETEVAWPAGHLELVGLADLADRATGLLQRYAVDLADAQAKLGRLAGDAATHGLDIDGWVVVDRWGPRRLDATSSTAHADTARALQSRLDRIHSHIGRARAHLVRSCDDLTITLRDTSERLRAEAGSFSG